MSTDIRASTILPAERRPVTLTTADGLELVGELALPPEGRAPAGTLVTLHPLPTHGGFMDSHIYRKAAWRLPALADLAVLRFNTRGTVSPAGRSQGEFDHGVGERFDVQAAIEFVDFTSFDNVGTLPNRWLIGWSFGTDLALMYGDDPTIDGLILLSPPLRYSRPEDLDRWGASGKPVVVLVPEFDDYLRPAEAAERFARIPQAEVIGVDGAKHLWVGEKYVQRVHNEIVQRVNPAAVPLPTTWDGTFETFTE